LAIAVAEQVSAAATPAELQALFARVQAKEVDSLIALFRIRISEDPQRNLNPPVGSLTVDGVAQPVGATYAVLPGQRHTLDLSVADTAFESYTSTTPSGPQQNTERLLAAWYSTTGRFSQQRTALREAVKTVLTAPGTVTDDPIPERRTGSLYVVLRDTRGGQSWQSYPLFICDSSLVEPEPMKVTWGPQVVVEGSNLDQLLDVVVSGSALKGSYNPSTLRWEASPPALASGT
jgi:hypothetical protein